MGFLLACPRARFRVLHRMAPCCNRTRAANEEAIIEKMINEGSYPYGMLHDPSLAMVPKMPKVVKPPIQQP